MKENNLVNWVAMHFPFDDYAGPGTRRKENKNNGTRWAAARPNAHNIRMRRVAASWSDGTSLEFEWKGRTWRNTRFVLAFLVWKINF